MRKIRFHLYTVPEYEEEQEYLTEQHKKGWKFIKFIMPGIYIFEKCDPEDVIYQLDYNQDGLRDKEAYYQIYRDCGWEHICDVMGYSYFRKLAENNNSKDEIFSDEASKLDMIERVYRGRMVPCLVIFFAIICPQMVIQALCGRTINFVLFAIYLFLFLLYVVMFIKFYIKRKKLLNKLSF